MDRRIGKYKILERKGVGASGTVYLCTHEDGGEFVVKVANLETVNSPIQRKRFVREGEALKKKIHKNIVPVVETIDNEQVLAHVMPAFGAVDLAEFVRKNGYFKPDDFKLFFSTICDALAALHSTGIYHRDLKPENILVTTDTVPYLIDLGSAHSTTATSKMTKTGAWVGTIDFMPPEILEGDHFDQRSEIYCLGMTMYLACTGSEVEKNSPMLPPTPREEGFKPSQRHKFVDQKIDRIVAKCTAKDPMGRYLSCRQLKKILDGGDESIETATSNSECLVCSGPVEGNSVCAKCYEGEQSLGWYIAGNRLEVEDFLQRVLNFLGGPPQSNLIRWLVWNGYLPVIRTHPKVKYPMKKLKGDGVALLSGRTAASKLLVHTLVLVVSSLLLYSFFNNLQGQLTLPLIYVLTAGFFVKILYSHSYVYLAEPQERNSKNFTINTQGMSDFNRQICHYYQGILERFDVLNRDVDIKFTRVIELCQMKEDAHLSLESLVESGAVPRNFETKYLRSCDGIDKMRFRLLQFVEVLSDNSIPPNDRLEQADYLLSNLEEAHGEAKNAA